jgi:hypothetical protein
MEHKGEHSKLEEGRMGAPPKIAKGQSEVLEEFWALLNGLNLNMVGVFFDDDFVYHGVIAVDILCTGKWNAQRVWRKHLIFRTRL